MAPEENPGGWWYARAWSVLWAGGKVRAGVAAPDVGRPVGGVRWLPRVGGVRVKAVDKGGGLRQW